MATAMDEPPDSSTALADEANTANTIIAAFDPTLLAEYLTDLAVVILNASREDLQLSLLSYPDTLQRCSRFAADPNNLVLYLRKEAGEGAPTTIQNGNPAIICALLTYFSGDSKTPFVYYLGAEYSAGPTTVASVAIIKRPIPLDSSIPLANQLVTITLPGATSRTTQEAVSPFENLHSLVRFGISPYFDSYTRGETDQTVRRGKGIDDAKTGIGFTIF